MSADDTYDERVAQRRRFPNWLTNPRYAEGGLIKRLPLDEDSVHCCLSEGKAITDPDEAEALGLTADFDRLNPVVRAAVLEDRRRLWREQNADKVRANEGLDPWTVEMLSAIADANEAYKGDDCE